MGIQSCTALKKSQAPVCRVYHSLGFWYLKEKSETYWSGLNL